VTPTPDDERALSFRVKWDGRFVAEVAKMSPLRRTTEVVVHRDGGSPNFARRSPGRTAFHAVTLERGVIVDVEFERWADKVFDFAPASAGAVSLKDFRKDVRIELYDASGRAVRAYRIFRCWVSEYRATSNLSATGGTVFESIRLENEGWERDLTVNPPPTAD
jgi:phage tail-like protein